MSSNKLACISQGTILASARLTCLAREHNSGAGMAEWWECSPPTDSGLVPYSVEFVDGPRLCSSSVFLRWGTLGFHPFSNQWGEGGAYSRIYGITKSVLQPTLSNQYFQVPIHAAYRNWIKTARADLASFVDIVIYLINQSINQLIIDLFI